jgi:hypothetical protein
MPTSPETFSKVKNLLRKLDQSIDSARSKRLDGARPAAAPPVRPAMIPANPGPPPAPIPAFQAGGVPQPLRARAMARPQIQQRPAV